MKKNILTVGDLRALIAEYPDSTPLQINLRQRNANFPVESIFLQGVEANRPFGVPPWEVARWGIALVAADNNQEVPEAEFTKPVERLAAVPGGQCSCFKHRYSGLVLGYDRDCPLHGIREKETK